MQRHARVVVLVSENGKLQLCERSAEGYVAGTPEAVDPPVHRELTARYQTAPSGAKSHSLHVSVFLIYSQELLKLIGTPWGS